ncbi:MAG: DNA mismatch repair endonuclease MutL, partial [Dehalococcoidia bacterium]|nr:DNA mismatch repair endonuclease MutL [Dehalococcoidia bacterium]
MNAGASIRRLSPQVVGKIAAGEVVERPASVVKELVENSLDAGARQIGVAVGRGGLDLIRVSDDGHGIDSAELPLAFERYATSKLSSEGDLERVATLGFRGEALPSIAAVAEVEMASRPPDDAAGAFVRLEEGVVVDSGGEGMPAGTSVVVRRLFGRQPARLKFLRSPAAEAAQIATVVSHYALAYPEVRFSLTVDGRLTLHTPGSGRVADAAAGVYGQRVAESLLSISLEEAVDAAAESDALSVTGLVGAPPLSRANRSYISLFVNRRWIRSRLLTYAVEEAYRGLLTAGRFPIAIVDIRIPPGDVDVNVHPAKTEVRLRRERDVFSVIQRRVRGVLSRHSPVPDLSASAWAGSGAGVVAGAVVEGGGQRAPAGQPGLLPQSGTLSPLPPSVEGPSPLRQLPVLRALGQVGMTYVVAEGPEGLYLVDQHAAHERILFERFLSHRDASAAERQALLEPLPVELTPRQQALVEEMAEALEEQGFSLEPFGERAYLVRAVPAALGEKDVAQAVLRFLDLVEREDAVSDRRERVAISLACHSAIRAGQALNPEEMRELLRQLEETQMPRTCPHGRPTMIHLSADALAREF